MKCALVCVFVTLAFSLLVDADKACDMCKDCMKAVKDKYPDVSQLTAIGLLQTAQAKCAEIAETPVQKEACKKLVADKAKGILAYVKKEGTIDPKLVCTHEGLCTK